MALTYRSVKGSALTINELDNNFRHFTGSHAITGSLTVTAYSPIPYQRPITNSLGATNFTCSSNEVGNFILAGFSTPCTMSIGTNAEKPNIPIGAEFEILNTGSAQMAFTASAGVTLFTQQTFTSVSPYSSGNTGMIFKCKKLGTDTWMFAQDKA